MRRIALSFVAVAALTAPALAEVSVADIGPNADRDFWCAAAFGVLVYTLQQQGDAPAAESASANMTALFTGIATSMKDKGMAKEDYDALVASYTNAVMDPFAKAEKAFSRDDCDAAAADAVKAMPAAQ
jgi:hypothetical protein